MQRILTFYQQKISVFVIFMYEVLTNRVNFEQLAPGVISKGFEVVWVCSPVTMRT